MPPDPTVFVVDDDPAMRDSLRWLLQSVGLPVQTYAAAEEFLEHYDATWPGCLVLDVRMPGMSGLKLQDVLAARHIQLPVIVVTGYAEVPTAVRALKTGAIDFIEKPFSDELLLDRVRQAIEADRQTREAEARRAAAMERFTSLTPREREVMKLVTAGKANKVIAAELNLSPKTVEVHRANVMKKMEVDSVADLVRASLLLQSDQGKP
ncbi:MAG: response regulator transcription factor [Candidatus Binatia bacterium]